MPRGGYRPGAGRPPKFPEPPKREPSEPRRNTAQPLHQMTGREWLLAVVNDPDAAPARKDRAAAVLAGIEARRDSMPGKKATAEAEAEWAGYGGPWWPLLHPDGYVPKSPMPPAIREELRRKERSPEEHASKWSELLDKRHNPLPPSDDDGWGTDLDFNPPPKTPDPDDDGHR